MGFSLQHVQQRRGSCSLVVETSDWSNNKPGCLGGKLEWVLKAEKINFYSCNSDRQEWIDAFTEIFPLCTVKASLRDSLCSKYCPQGIVSSPIIMMSAIGKLYLMEKLASSHLIYILHNYSGYSWFTTVPVGRESVSRLKLFLVHAGV